MESVVQVNERIVPPAAEGGVALDDCATGCPAVAPAALGKCDYNQFVAQENEQFVPPPAEDGAALVGSSTRWPGSSTGQI